MKVTLVSITKPLVEGISTAEEYIVWAARISNPTNRLNTETAPKLLSYLIRHQHWSPFEQVSLGVEIETSRAIAPQILRHRSFVFQEFSQRYASTAPRFESFEPLVQGETNRQSGVERASISVSEFFQGLQTQINDACFGAYTTALELGIAREQARALLPLSVGTTLIMTGSLRSWIHYINLRTQEGTQLPHRQIALACRDLVAEQFSNVAKALEWP